MSALIAHLSRLPLHVLFGERALSHGRDYFTRGSVKNLRIDEEGAKAEVVGHRSQPYKVALLAGEGRLTSRCSCMASGDWDQHCKHAVAVALACVSEDRALAIARLKTAVAKVAEKAPPLRRRELERWSGVHAEPARFRYELGRGKSGGWTLLASLADRPGEEVDPRKLAAHRDTSPEDRRILSVIAREGLWSWHGHELDEAALADLMPLLLRRRVSYDGAPVTAGPALAPKLRVKQAREGGLKLSIDLGPLDGLLVGSRTWVIRERTAHPLEPCPPGHLLNMWRTEPQMSVGPADARWALTTLVPAMQSHGVQPASEDLVILKGPPKFRAELTGAGEKIVVRVHAAYGPVNLPVTPAARDPIAILTGHSISVVYRDLEAEAAALAELTLAGLSWDAEAGGFSADGDRALELWSGGLSQLPAAWQRHAPAEGMPRLREAAINARAHVDAGPDGWFDLALDFWTAESQVSLESLKAAVAAGRHWVKLVDGSYARADRGALVDALDALDAMSGPKGRLPGWDAGLVAALCATPGATVGERAHAALAALTAPATEEPNLAGLHAELRPYQQAGVRWLWKLCKLNLGGVLADEMGLGKTVQTLALFLAARNALGPAPSLVIAPTSVLTNWEREAARFTPGFKVTVYSGAHRAESRADLGNADIVVTSYALLRRDHAILAETRWRYVVLDEAQQIKNDGTLTAKAARTLSAQHRLALTGTPLENRLGDLRSIFDFLNPGCLGGPEQFRRRWERPAEQGDTEVLVRLRRRTGPFILRRLKSEVASELPPRTDSVLWVEMSDAQKALYREALLHAREELFPRFQSDGFNKHRAGALAALTHLRQVCCDPRLVPLHGITPPPSAKLETFASLVEELIAGGHRALVFSQFVKMLTLLREWLDQRGIAYAYLDGRTRDRQARVDQFNEKDGPPLFLISLKAGGSGLNLPAADYVVHFDPWWNPAVEEQATARAHRIGQTRPVVAYKLMTRGTVEEKIFALQQTKLKMIEGTLGADEGAVLKALGEDDVRALFDEA